MIVSCILYGLIVLLMVPADAATLSFDGAQHSHVNLDSVSRTAAEDWRLRFRTSKSSGLIFSSMPEGQHSGRVELGLDADRLRFTQYSIDRPKVSWVKDSTTTSGIVFPSPGVALPSGWLWTMRCQFKVCVFSIP